MKITISKSKNTKIYYLSKSIRVDGKSTTKTVKKLGTEKEVAKMAGNQDPYQWAKDYAKKLTKLEKIQNKERLVKFSPAKQIDKNTQVLFNGGYLFLKSIYNELGLNKIAQKIKNSSNFEYNLNSILSNLIYGRIIFPSSKISTFESSKTLLEKPKFELHQIYRGLSVLANNSDFIQSALYKNTKEKRNSKILYYDCTNFFFEIEEDDELRKYGKSKEHRPNPIVQMGLFMDGDGIPLSFCITPGNANEQKTLIPLEKKIVRDFELSKFIVCTDAGLSSNANKKFNNIESRFYITTQSLKKLKKHLKDWALSSNGFKLIGSDKEFDVSQIDEYKYYNSVFYKERWINENGIEERLVVTYSPKYKEYQRDIRNRQLDRAKKIIDNGDAYKTRNQNNPARYIEEINATNNGEVATKKSQSLNKELIIQDEAYDGFYAVATNLEGNAKDILKVNKNRWEIEESFKIMKSDFKSRPVYLQREDRIKAHFLTCFLALVVFRNLEKKLNNKYTCNEILKKLKEMNFYKIEGEGYIPTYKRDDLTDMLHKEFGFNTDFEILTNTTIKEIFKITSNS